MNRKLWVAPLALSVALAGCDDMLTETPSTFLTTETFYKTPADVEMATFAAYRPLGEGNLYNWWMWITLDLASDQVRAHPDEPNFAAYHPEFLQWDETQGSITAPWRGFYDMVFRSNLVLSRAPGVKFPDANQQKELIAEAKFLRAYAYLTLTKLYGDVPLLLSEEEHAKFEVARTPVEQVHAQVLKDLTEAAADLPMKPRSHGRASKGAAWMALADLHSWRSSFLKKNEWDKTAAAAKNVVVNYPMMDDYLKAFLPATKANSEVIFMKPGSGVDGRTSSSTGCLFLPRQLGFGTRGGCEVIGQPTMWQFNSYPVGDYRKDVTYRTEGCSSSARIGCIKLEWPNVNKYRPTNEGIAWQPSDVDYPLYRSAEAHLLLAEALNEMGKTSEAIMHVNHVRARARNADGKPRSEPADLPGSLSMLAARDAIYQERALELAHEGKRWYDLVRRDSLEPGYWKSSLQKHDPNAAARGDLSEHKKRWPIPKSEMERNSALTQNSGY